MLFRSNIEKMIILIQVTNNYNYEDVRRLIHELTHAYDFIKYANVYTNGKILNFRNRPLFNIYELYSEFCAYGYDEFYAYIFQDLITNRTDLDTEMKNQDQLLEKYILSKRDLLLSGTFSDYNLFQTLGKIYAFDKYNQIKDCSESLIYKYIPLLFHTINKEHIYELYKLCYSSKETDSIFTNLQEISSLLELIC